MHNFMLKPRIVYTVYAILINIALIFHFNWCAYCLYYIHNFHTVRKMFVHFCHAHRTPNTTISIYFVFFHLKEQSIYLISIFVFMFRCFVGLVGFFSVSFGVCRVLRHKTCVPFIFCMKFWRSLAVKTEDGKKMYTFFGINDSNVWKMFRCYHRNCCYSNSSKNSVLTKIIA